MGGHGDHAETTVIDGLWRLSRDEISLDSFLAVHGCQAPIQGAELSSR